MKRELVRVGWVPSALGEGEASDGGQGGEVVGGEGEGEGEVEGGDGSSSDLDTADDGYLDENEVGSD